jgi:hypothetical protein
MSEPKLFLAEYRSDGHTYVRHIISDTWENAQAEANQRGETVFGELDCIIAADSGEEIPASAVIAGDVALERKH